MHNRIPDRFKNTPWADHVQESPPSENWKLKYINTWTIKRCWLPNQCFLTGKQLWGKKAYCGSRYIHGPDAQLLVKYWIDKNEFLIWSLKGRQ